LDAVRKDGICEVSGGYYVRVGDVVGDAPTLIPESMFEDFSDEDLLGLLESRRKELGDDVFCEVFGGVLPNNGVGDVIVADVSAIPSVQDPTTLLSEVQKSGIDVILPVSSSVTANSNPLESQTFEPFVSAASSSSEGGPLAQPVIPNTVVEPPVDDGNFGDL